MAWQSPYRGEEDPLPKLPPRVREWLSRGTMLVVGLVLVWLTAKGVRGMLDVSAMAAASTTQPGARWTGSRRQWTIWDTLIGVILLWLGLALLALIAGGFIAAAVLPAGALQETFERWYRPPQTADRAGEYTWRDRWWWLWPW